MAEENIPQGVLEEPSELEKTVFQNGASASDAAIPAPPPTKKQALASDALVESDAVQYSSDDVGTIHEMKEDEEVMQLDLSKEVESREKDGVVEIPKELLSSTCVEKEKEEVEKSDHAAAGTIAVDGPQDDDRIAVDGAQDTGRIAVDGPQDAGRIASDGAQDTSTIAFDGPPEDSTSRSNEGVLNGSYSEEPANTDEQSVSLDSSGQLSSDDFHSQTESEERVENGDFPQKLAEMSSQVPEALKQAPPMNIDNASTRNSDLDKVEEEQETVQLMNESEHSHANGSSELLRHRLHSEKPNPEAPIFDDESECEFPVVVPPEPGLLVSCKRHLEQKIGRGGLFVIGFLTIASVLFLGMNFLYDNSSEGCGDTSHPI